MWETAKAATEMTRSARSNTGAGTFGYKRSLMRNGVLFSKFHTELRYLSTIMWFLQKDNGYRILGMKSLYHGRSSNQVWSLFHQ